VPLLATVVGLLKAAVAPAFVQYDNVPLPVLPAVTAAAVIFTVFGEHTAAGLVIVKTGAGLTVTATASISEQEPSVLLI
jgi:hypothetical protein